MVQPHPDGKSESRLFPASRNHFSSRAPGCLPAGRGHPGDHARRRAPRRAASRADIGPRRAKRIHRLPHKRRVIQTRIRHPIVRQGTSGHPITTCDRIRPARNRLPHQTWQRGPAEREQEMISLSLFHSSLFACVQSAESAKRKQAIKANLRRLGDGG